MPDPVTMLPERAMVFIDLMNLYESLGDLSANTNVDYFKLAQKLAEAQRRLIRCYVYTGAYDQRREPDKYAGQMRFISKIHKMPFVTLKNTPPPVSRGRPHPKGRGHPHRYRHGVDGLLGAL